MKGGWRGQLSSRVGGTRLRFDAPLRQTTTLRIGGSAECLAEPENEGDLVLLFQAIAGLELPYHVLGKGSNVLIPDEGLSGVVVRLGRGFQQIGRDGPVVSAGAGCPNAALVEQCRRWGLAGLEFLIAVPGTVGGAVAMNAGAHQGDTASRLSTVRFFSIGAGLKTKKITEKIRAADFAYRKSPLRADLGVIVTGAEFNLTPAPQAEIEQKVVEYQTYRRQTQPRDFPNCGSVFKNPPGSHAARLIEEAGLKGERVGDAQVSEKHANFIVNRGGASAAQVVELIDLIRGKVYHQTGTTLELELKLL
ncbi:MAG: UDP-N-acetylmuramate dehydrogenase [bacterium]